MIFVTLRRFLFPRSPTSKRSWASLLVGGAIALDPSSWSTLYTGHGEVRFTPSGISMKTAGAMNPKQTHAALVLSKINDAQYFDVEVTFRNIQTLRLGKSEPWEVFWLFFNYQTDTANKKKTNYIILKPNGLEIGKATGEVHQAILKTWPQPVSLFGKDHRMRLQRLPTKMIITVDGSPDVVYEFAKDSEKPFDQKGNLGLYVEDAEILVKSFSFKAL